MMNKKLYQTPKFNIIEISTREDILLTSVEWSNERMTSIDLSNDDMWEG